MRLQTNLVRRGARYYFRSRVPEDLRVHYGRSEFLVSLKTSDRSEAERVMTALKARLLDDFTRLRGLPKVDLFFPVIAASGGNDARAGLRDLVIYWKSQSQRAPRTLLEIDTVVKRFGQVNGDVAADAIERLHVVTFKDRMLADGKSVATVKKYLGLLSAVLETAAANERIQANPVRGIKLTRPKVQQKARVPFTVDELNRIFSSPVFTRGLRPMGGKGEAAYWLPLLGLWTGARLEELGQLRVGDVLSEDGIDFIAITDDPSAGRRIKTDGSPRRVPTPAHSRKKGPWSISF